MFKNKNEYKFTYNNNTYIFMPQERGEVELIEINSYIENSNIYDKILKNIYNKLYTTINNKNYILVKKNKPMGILNSILNAKRIDMIYNYSGSINRSNWGFLWCKKVDYIEYELLHINNKYKIITNSIWYYIGMAETAISYIYDNDSNNDLVISHKRICKDNFNNPNNIIIDNRSRDISEYLKYIFFNNNYDYTKIKELLSKINGNYSFYRLMYGRMFFPTFYFDIYDEIINERENEEKLKKVINRFQEYEDYLKNIYKIIIEFIDIPEITWI